MRTTRIRTLLLVALLVTSLPTVSDELDYARLIERTASSIDQLLALEHRTLVAMDSRGRSRGHKIKPLDRQKALPSLAFMLHMPESMLAKAFIEQKHHLSEILFARHIAEHETKPFEEVLRKQTRADWIALMKKAKIPLKDVLANFDAVFNHLALLALDAQMK